MLICTGYGLLQLYAGYIGIDYHFGSGWGITVSLLAIVLRIPLLISIGAFFGAMDVWGWHWGLALLFSAPGFIALLILGLVASPFKK